VAQITVHGGDFTKGVGGFHANGFTLLDQHGIAVAMPLGQLTTAQPATAIALSVFGAGARLWRDFERARKSIAAGHYLFIAKFADRRLLLASTDQVTFEQIIRTPGG
jgi:hypothetical protein